MGLGPLSSGVVFKLIVYRYIEAERICTTNFFPGVVLLIEYRLVLPFPQDECIALRYIVLYTSSTCLLQS